MCLKIGDSSILPFRQRLISSVHECKWAISQREDTAKRLIIFITHFVHENSYKLWRQDIIRMFQRKESQGSYKDCIIRGEIISGKKKNPHSSGNAIQKGNVFLRRLDFHRSCNFSVRTHVKFTRVNEIEAISVKGHAWTCMRFNFYLRA